MRWIQSSVLTAAGLTLVATLFASLLVAQRFSLPLVELAEVARGIQAGNYRQRVNTHRQDEIGVLANAFNDMSQFYAEQMEKMGQDREELRAVLASMVEGVLVVDSQHRAQFFNHAAARMLDLPASGQGQLLRDLSKQSQLHDAVEAVLASDEACHRELSWNTPEKRVMLAQGARLRGHTPLGAVLVLHDVTNLRQLERVRQDFVSNVSHELKTPLAAIKANVETLLEGAWQDAEHAPRFLGRIQESADRLHRLVLDLLSLGRIEGGGEQYDIQAIEVQAAVKACLARYEELANGRGVKLAACVPPDGVRLLADEEALAQILDNLVENAVKYTLSGGEVAITWNPTESQVAINVRDTGIGIGEKELPRVFERFYRVDRARSRELGGTGLGLSIVKHLAQALGGSVSAASKIGAGSTFTVCLPQADALQA